MVTTGLHFAYAFNGPGVEEVPRRVLWIGAHPDDELFVAPFLGAMHARGAAVRFLVATRGEQGPCYRPEGCESDLATVREGEMRAAADVFGGSVVFADCRDGSGGTPELVRAAWAAGAGGDDALLARFATAMDAFAPDLILTFDGNHGATNHPDHIAVGRLAAELPRSAPLLLAESRLSWRPPLTVTPAVRDAVAFDARDWWIWLLRDVACHRSQMRPETIDMFGNTPDDQRRVWLRDLA